MQFPDVHFFGRDDRELPSDCYPAWHPDDCRTVWKYILSMSHIQHRFVQNLLQAADNSRWNSF